jgi:hypothetical protein
MRSCICNLHELKGSRAVRLHSTHVSGCRFLLRCVTVSQSHEGVVL